MWCGVDGRKGSRRRAAAARGMSVSRSVGRALPRRRRNRALHVLMLSSKPRKQTRQCRRQCGCAVKIAAASAAG